MGQDPLGPCSDLAGILAGNYAGLPAGDIGERGFGFMSMHWIFFGVMFALWIAFVVWTTLKFGSEESVDLLWLKGKSLTDRQVRKLKALGLSEDEIQDLTK